MNKMIIIVGCLFLLSGCSNKEEDLQSRVYELEQKLNEANSKLEDIQYTVNELDNIVSNFSYDDWKDVVPEVQDKVDELKYKCQ